MATDIRTLQPGDAPALLAFESNNRSWFEQHIEARPPGFFTLSAIEQHIAQYLAGHERGQWHPCVLTEGETIIGRANLKDIDRELGVAEIGYRIARGQAGKGLATMAVAHSLRLASAHCGLERVFAKVTEDNPASARVLLKNGFVQGAYEPNMALVGARWIGGFEYACAMPGARPAPKP